MFDVRPQSEASNPVELLSAKTDESPGKDAMSVNARRPRAGLAGCCETLRRLVAGLEPEVLTAADAMALWELFNRVERFAGAGKALLAHGAARSQAWKEQGYLSAADHLARLAGTTVNRARDELAASRQLATQPAVDRALRSGAISVSQAREITDAVADDPDAASHLLETASAGSMKELRDACGRVKAHADPNPQARRKRQRARRSLRHRRLADGSWSMTVRGLPEDQGVIDAALRPGIERRFRQDRRDGRRERHDARAYDELLAMARSYTRAGRNLDPADEELTGCRDAERMDQPPGQDDGHPGSTETDRVRTHAEAQEPLWEQAPSQTDHRTRTARKRRRGKRRAPNPSYLTLVHVSLEALLRGSTAGDERCEIPGAGSVSVAAARELIGDSILKLVVSKGQDVASVTHLGRGPTAAQKIALLWKQPLCAAEGCCRTIVQSDHRIDWSQTRHTRLDELDHLCGHHHNLKTRKGWALVAGTGKRALVPPTDPRHPNHTSSPEKQAA